MTLNDDNMMIISIFNVRTHYILKIQRFSTLNGIFNCDFMCFLTVKAYKKFYNLLLFDNKTNCNITHLFTVKWRSPSLSELTPY